VTAAECISFLTDYGLADGFVAACHGVLLRRAPGVPVLDVTHLVPPGDVRRGAVVLAQTLPYLPRGVHLAVVDPGVGTERRGLVLEADRGTLVGPDNGLLPWAADALGGIRRAYDLRPGALGVEAVSPTFHGRDLFAPAAGELARGRPAAELGSQVDPDTVVRLPHPVCRVTGGEVTAEVVTVDRFGNVQLAADRSAVERAGWVLGDPVRTGDVVARYGTTFGSVGPGEPVAYLDSAGLLSLAVRDGRADELFGVRPGELVRLSAGGR
jgi:S-adenosylmethionine hydrolase